MSISPQPKSNETSRPASPAADALDMLSLDDEAITPEEAMKMKANNRKSSSWKGLKNQLSKAEMKIKNTFADPFSKERKGSVVFYGLASDGTMISPVELSPDSVESYPSSLDQDEPVEKEKTDKIADLIKNIEELGSVGEEIPTKFESDKKHVLKKVDFAEEISKKSSCQIMEDSRVSRPSDLNYEVNDVPIVPPRMKRDGSKRLERLFSVPNIKLDKADQSRLLNLRKTSNIIDQKSNKNKGNFIRRFSKYLFLTCKLLSIF